MELKFEAVILQNEDMDAAYVEVPYDIKKPFGSLPTELFREIDFFTNSIS